MQLIFHNVPRVSMALPSYLAVLDTQRPAGERAKRSKLAQEMVSSVQLPPAKGYPWYTLDDPILL